MTEMSMTAALNGPSLASAMSRLHARYGRACATYPMERGVSSAGLRRYSAHETV